MAAYLLQGDKCGQPNFGSKLEHCGIERETSWRVPKRQLRSLLFLLSCPSPLLSARDGTGTGPGRPSPVPIPGPGKLSSPCEQNWGRSGLIGMG